MPVGHPGATSYIPCFAAARGLPELQEPRLLVGVGAVGGFAYLSSTIAVVEFGGLSTLNFGGGICLNQRLGAITTHIGVTGLASYYRYRRIEHVHWITSKHWTGSPPIATVLAAER